MDLPVNHTELNSFSRKAVREEYVERQNGLCYYCKCSLSEEPPTDILEKFITKSLYPDDFFKWPIHLHHNHETGMTIGAVHCHCNAVLWEYEGE